MTASRSFLQLLEPQVRDLLFAQGVHRALLQACVGRVALLVLVLRNGQAAEPNERHRRQGQSHRSLPAV